VELLGLPLATSGSRPACPRLHSLADSRSRGDLRDGQIGAAGEDGRCPADIAGIFQARDPGSRLQVPPRSEEREQSGNCEGGKREGGTDTATYIQAIVPPRCISCSVASSVGTAPMSSLDFDRRGGGGGGGVGGRDKGQGIDQARSTYRTGSPLSYPCSCPRLLSAPMDHPTIDSRREELAHPETQSPGKQPRVDLFIPPLPPPSPLPPLPPFPRGCLS